MRAPIREKTFSILTRSAFSMSGRSPGQWRRLCSDLAQVGKDEADPLANSSEKGAKPNEHSNDFHDSRHRATSPYPVGWLLGLVGVAFRLIESFKAGKADSDQPLMKGGGMP